MKNENYEYILRHAKKIKAIRILGGKCEKCGNENYACLDFHHNKDKDKEDNINSMFSNRWSKLEKEIKKCSLLCRNCHQEKHSKEYIGTRCRELKNKFLEIKGVDRCEKCGFKGENTSSLDFHHKNKEEKDFSIGNAYRFITDYGEKIIKEIEKCVVLCSNCHAIEHFNFKRLEDSRNKIEEKIGSYKELKVVDYKELKRLRSIGFSSKKICLETGLSPSTVSTSLSKLGLKAITEGRNYEMAEVEKICLYCKNIFIAKGAFNAKNKMYCNVKCKQLDIKLKITKEELIELLKTESYSSLARKYNVAPNTVKNLAKRFCLITGV